MRRTLMQVAGWMAAGCLSVALTALPATAQGRVRVNIPFSFSAGAESLPAGQYVIERTGMAGTSLLRIASVDGRDSTMLMTLPVRHRGASGNPRLLFEVLAGNYRLAELWSAGADTGAQLPRTKEQALIAKRTGPIETFALALPSVVAGGL